MFLHLKFFFNFKSIFQFIYLRNSRSHLTVILKLIYCIFFLLKINTQILPSFAHYFIILLNRLFVFNSFSVFKFMTYFVVVAHCLFASIAIDINCHISRATCDIRYIVLYSILLIEHEVFLAVRLLCSIDMFE